MNTLKILAGNGNRPLAEKIASEIGIKITPAEVKEFSDGESRVLINETVRACDVFIIQPTGAPTNRNLMELALLIDAAKRSSARTVNAVVPYYGYGRQDRMVGRSPVSAKVVADIIQTVGAHRMLTLDLHNPAIEGFFSCPVDNMAAIPLLADYFKNKNLNDAVVVSPDVGGVKRARLFSMRMELPIAIVDKLRPKPNMSEVANVVGDVNGKECIIIDDMVDTGGSLLKAASTLLDRGAVKVYCAATHAVLSGPAFERIGAPEISELVVTDTLPLPANAPKKIVQLSVAPMLAEAIKRMYSNKSISELFKTTDEG